MGINYVGAGTVLIAKQPDMQYCMVHSLLLHRIIQKRLQRYVTDTKYLMHRAVLPLQRLSIH